MFSKFTLKAGRVELSPQQRGQVAKAHQLPELVIFDYACVIEGADVAEVATSITYNDDGVVVEFEGEITRTEIIRMPGGRAYHAGVITPMAVIRL